MITLSREQIKRLHKKMIEATGGLDGLRDEGISANELLFWGNKLWTRF